MGLLRRLLGLGVVAGATYATIKVTEKYNANKAAAEANGEEYADVMGGIKQAATEVYNETGEKVRSAAQNAGIDTDKIGADFKEMAGKVKDAAGEIYAGARDAINEAMGNAKEDAEVAADTFEAVAHEVKDEVEDAAEEVKEAVEDLKSEE